MSAAIQQAIQRSHGVFANLQNRVQGNHHHASKFGHLDFLLHVPAKSTIPSTSLTSEAIIDFEFKQSPSHFMKDNKSLYLVIKALESGGSNSVKPTFVEAFFNKNASFEWLCGGKSYTNPIPMMQALLEPALQMSDDEYTAMVNTLNHNATQLYTSPQSIAASGTAVYIMRIPNNFPKDGFWWGALFDKVLTLRIKTQNAVDAGSGTLAVTSDGFQIYSDCITVPADEFSNMEQAWAYKQWHADECLLNEPNSIVTVSSGESPTVKLENFKNLQVSYILSFIHASRSFTASAYFNLVDPNAACKFYVRSKDGSQIFTSNSEYFAFNKYWRAIRQFSDSKLLQYRGYLLVNPSPDIQRRIHQADHDEGKYIFDGEEVIVISDLGSASTYFVDSIAFFDSYFQIQYGEISKIPV